MAAPLKAGSPAASEEDSEAVATRKQFPLDQWALVDLQHHLEDPEHQVAFEVGSVAALMADDPLAVVVVSEVDSKTDPATAVADEAESVTQGAEDLLLVAALEVSVVAQMATAVPLQMLLQAQADDLHLSPQVVIVAQPMVALAHRIAAPALHQWEARLKTEVGMKAVAVVAHMMTDLLATAAAAVEAMATVEAIIVVVVAATWNR